MIHRTTRRVPPQFPIGLSCALKNLASLAPFVLLGLALVGCFGILGDPPENWEYHEHPLVLYVRTINQELDTTGISSCIVPVTKYSYSRPSRRTVSGEGDLNYDFERQFADTIQLTLVNPDTDWHVYRDSVRHFSGYQRHMVLDTMRLSVLSTDTGWHMSLVGYNGTARLKSGGTAPVPFYDMGPLPDTVRDTIRVELVCDASKDFSVHVFGQDTVVYMSEDSFRLRQR